VGASLFDKPKVGDDAGREYAAPELLPVWSDKQEIRFRPLLRHPADAEVVLRYDFLHDGIARRFLAQVGAKAKHLAVYLKYGCWFHDARTESEVIVRGQERKTKECLTGAMAWASMNRVGNILLARAIPCWRR
jgi:hypothetical protein